MTKVHTVGLDAVAAFCDECVTQLLCVFVCYCACFCFSVCFCVSVCYGVIQF